MSDEEAAERTCKDVTHNEYMFSARMEKGPVTPSMVRGWMARREKTMPHSPVLRTTSIVPQFLPVSTMRSLANVIPGRRLVKKTYTALATIN